MLLELTHHGIYCRQADVYIDPLLSVDKAIITHAHADHARAGNRHYLAHRLTVPLLKLRLGARINTQSVEYGEVVTINDVKFSLHPAGHVVGSAQIRVEYQGEVWVVSGDYKLEDDGISAPFELVKCNTFITEATFAWPIYKWQDQKLVYAEMNEWWKQNKERGETSILFCYSLGKSQRLLHNLDRSIGPIYAHNNTVNINEVLRVNGVDLPLLTVPPEIGENFAGSMILTPASAQGTAWMRKFQPYSVGNSSGWMQVRGMRKRNGGDRGFILSDHADWAGLNKVVAETGAEQIYVTHGSKDLFARYLREQGYQADDLDQLKAR